jgi:lipopolysaccharide/colanic/teichoic acid biosynthesis glycosyltransferase
MAGRLTGKRQYVQQGQGSLQGSPGPTDRTNEGMLAKESQPAMSDRFTDDHVTLMQTAVTEPGGLRVSDAPLPPLAVKPATRRFDAAAKRAFDITASLLMLIALVPLVLIVALLVRLDSPGPAFFRVRRIGRDGRDLMMLKFRKMHDNAAGIALTTHGDDRLTRIGKFLARSKLDELPQLWHVLRGEMSLVGPRPLPIRDYRLLEDWHRKRYLVLPGMTGLWQIAGRSDLEFDDLVRLDFYYLENWSIWLDISILLRTIPAVAAGKGAY